VKVFIWAPPEDKPWIIERIYSEWHQMMNSCVERDILKADIIWLLNNWSWRAIPSHILKDKKVVTSIHHVTPTKFDEANFKARDEFTDCYHVPCKQTANFIKNYTDKPIEIVEYWVNPELWSPKDKTGCRKRLNLPLDDFIIGSFQRDTEGFDLKTPKLEKGPDLFLKYVDALDKERKHVLLGGWRRQYLINNFKERGIKHTYVEMAPFSTLCFMYGACDLYVVSSRFEGGPQAVLEASAMRTPIISTNVGMAMEVLSPNCIVDFDDDKVPTMPTKEDIEFNYQNVQNFSIEKQIEKYKIMFEKVL